MGNACRRPAKCANASSSAFNLSEFLYIDHAAAASDSILFQSNLFNLIDLMSGWIGIYLRPIILGAFIRFKKILFLR